MKNIVNEYIKTRKESLKRRDENVKKFNEGGAIIANIKCAFDDVLSINSAGVLYNTSVLSEHAFIPIQHIKKVEVLGGEEASENERGNQNTIFDFFSSLKKSREVLVIYYMKNELEAKKVIQTEMASAAAEAISEAIEKY